MPIIFAPHSQRHYNVGDQIEIRDSDAMDKWIQYQKDCHSKESGAAVIGFCFAFILCMIIGLFKCK